MAPMQLIPKYAQNCSFKSFNQLNMNINKIIIVKKPNMQFLEDEADTILGTGVHKDALK